MFGLIMGQTGIRTLLQRPDVSLSPLLIALVFLLPGGIAFIVAALSARKRVRRTPPLPIVSHVDRFVSFWFGERLLPLVATHGRLPYTLKDQLPKCGVRVHNQDL